MLGIGSTELVIILVFGFLLFGPDKLPQMGRTIGRALRQFRETQEKLTAVVQTEVVDPMAAAAKAPKVVVAAKDEDADAEGSASTEETPVRKETFAERRARLAAEKAEAEAAAAAEAGEDAEAPETASEAEPADTDVQAAEAPQAAAPEDAASPVEPAEPEVPAEPSIEDLYARRPSRRAKRAAELEQVEAEPAAEPEPAAEQDAAGESESASDQAEVVASPAPNSEEGGER